MAYTPEEIEEIQKLQKLVKQYEGLIRISRNTEQLNRTKVELKKIKDRLEILCPNGVPDNLVIETTLAGASSKRDPHEILKSKPTLSDFPFQKACKHCDDVDVNLLHTILNVWEEEFVPAMGDAHIQLEFSLANERDAHYSNLENIKRQLKILVDTTEDYTNASKEDMKVQLREMRQRYTRHYLQEGYNFLKKIREFWNKLSNDVQSGGTLCMNKDDMIHFNKKFETATYLNGLSAKDIIVKGFIFLCEAIEILNIPSLPTKK